LVSDIKGRTQAEMFENGVLRGIIGPKREGGSNRRLEKIT